MPCRTANLCRLQEQCLWITDDVLADAWSRFARLSNSSRSSVGGRRYGSSVPGPLEAHRRLAKRRMAIAAISGGGAAPGVDFGALFGWGAFGSQRKLDEWKYEPPGVDKVEKQDIASMFGLRLSKKDAWETLLQTLDSLQLSESSIDPIARSKSALENLLAAKTGLPEIQHQHLDDVFAFLQTTLDEPGARNAVRLGHWLTSRPASLDALESYLALVLEKVRLQTLQSRELSSIVISCILHQNVVQLLPSIRAILLAAGEGTAYVCSSTTRAILETIPVRGSPIRQPNALLDLWLRCLREHDVHKSASPVGWAEVYDILASRLPLPSVLADHLSTIRWPKLCQVLLQHWIPRIVSHDHELAQGHSFVVHNNFMTLKQSQRSELSSLSPSALLKRIEKNYQRVPRQASKSTLIYLLESLQRSGINPSPLAQDIFSILLFQGNSSSIYAIYKQMHGNRFVGVSTQLAIRLIKHFMGTGDLDYAWNVFKNCPTVALSKCYDLPLRLVERGMCTSSYIWTILQRQTPEDIVSESERLKPMQSLTSGHIDLIHRMALAYAESPHMRPRVAFRRVWECYIFLKDHDAPVRPLMTRAMVTAGVSRYLQDGRRKSSVHFRYILDVLARVEGREVADVLDRTVERVWRDSVLPTLRASNANENTNANLSGVVKISEEAPNVRFRPSKSTKRQRAWLAWDEQHYKDTRSGVKTYVGAIYERPPTGETASDARLPEHRIVEGSLQSPILDTPPAQQLSNLHASSSVPTKGFETNLLTDNALTPAAIARDGADNYCQSLQGNAADRKGLLGYSPSLEAQLSIADKIPSASADVCSISESMDSSEELDALDTGRISDSLLKEGCQGLSDSRRRQYIKRTEKVMSLPTPIDGSEPGSHAGEYRYQKNVEQCRSSTVILLNKNLDHDAGFTFSAVDSLALGQLVTNVDEQRDVERQVSNRVRKRQLVQQNFSQQQHPESQELLSDEFIRPVRLGHRMAHLNRRIMRQNPAKRQDSWASFHVQCCRQRRAMQHGPHQKTTGKVLNEDPA